MRKFIQRALEKMDRLDASQVRKLVQDLSVENDRLETVLDSLTTGVLVADNSNQIILGNKAGERLLSLSGTDYLEKNLWAVLQDPRMAAFVQKAIEDKETIHNREFGIQETGRVVSVSVMPFVRGGEIRGNLLHIQDVTEEKASQARLRRAESLASLTTLAAGVAHEIKNPLASMSIHLQLMEKNLRLGDKSDNATLSSWLGIVQEEVERLNRIVVDFLFTVRPMDISLEMGSVKQVVEEIASLVAPELEQSGIELKLELDDSVPEVFLDARFLKQAILNLVKNAIAAMPKGGVLSIRLLQKRENVLVSVQDNGTGIAENILPKIFEPFFTTRDTGSGIGLTMVYRIVKEHRGDIQVDTREGLGTTFSICLPIPQKTTPLIGWEQGSA